MLILLDKDEIYSRLEVPENAKNDERIDNALKSVGPRLESILQTTLSKSDGEYEEVFLVDSNVVYPQSGVYRLRLKNGFVAADSVTVYVAETLDEVMLETGLIDTPRSIDHAKGFVFLPTATVEDQHVRVKYLAGYDDADKEVPDWLVEAAYQFFLSALSANMVGELKPEIVKAMEAADKAGYAILDRHLRTLSMSVSPIY